MTPALYDTLGCLTRLSDQRTEPPAALDQIAAVGARHGADIELVWERDAYGGRVHYDALIRDGKNTISLSVCPDDGVPWPVRGLQRWADSDVVRVDGRVVTIQAAIDMLDLVWNEDRLLTRLVDAALLFREKDRRRLADPDPDELQEAIDDFRRERGLFTPEATEAWLSEHGLTLARLEAALGDRLVRDTIRDRVLAELGDPGTRRVPIDLDGDALRPYDRVLLTEVDAGHATATALAAAPKLLDAATAAAVGGKRVQVSATIRRFRRDLPPDVADAIADAEVGAVVGPFAVPGRWRVVEVLARVPADLQDPDTRAAVREAMFADWLAAERRKAHVEWSWGTAAIGAVR